ncbi:MAG TPA: YicC family protein [Myxococcales bacterium]|nr:YicC family protein [Myxococcales bacterium]
MIHSMTGFGAGKASAGGGEVSIEIRSVNHKYAEVKTRLPAELAPLEAELAKRIKERLQRGAIEVSIRRSSTGRSVLMPRVDIELAREYVAALAELGRQLSLERNLGLAELAQVEGVVSLETRPIDLEAARQALSSAVDQALESLVAMREREGAALAEDMLARLAVVRARAARIGELAPQSVEQYRARLEQRIAELSRGIQIDPQRLAQEVALFADRVDIAEELTRLASHLDQFERLVQGSGPTGRRMDFVVQELNREVNTIGSKSQSAEVAQLVVELKAEIERIREQVQNVE